jgi:hypothetical protein
MDRPNLEDRFIQPFPNKIGYDDYDNPTEDFIDFSDSDRVLILNGSLASLMIKMNVLTLLDIIGIDTINLCPIYLPLVWKNYQELMELSVQYPYIDILVKSIEENIYPGINYRFVPNSFWIDKLPKDVEACVRSNRKIFILNIALDYPHPRENRRVGHSNRVIVDLYDHKAFIIEPSLGFSQNAKEEAVELILRAYIDPDIKLERLDLNVCKPFSIQGKTDFCVSWAWYLLLLHLLNPTYTSHDINDVFRSYSQIDRDRCILQFLYYIDTLDLPSKIPNFIKKKIDTINRPKLV